MPGRLDVSLEGLDGSGKSTLAESLERHYRNVGIAVVGLTSPSRRPEGLALRRRLAELTPEEKDAAFSEDLRLSERQISPSADLVVWDRHIDSIYTSNSVPGDLNTLQKMAELAVDLKMPDLTFYLHLSVEDAYRRAAPITDHPLDREGLESKYLLYGELVGAYPDRIHIVDAMQPPDEVFDQATKLIGEHL